VTQSATTLKHQGRRRWQLGRIWPPAASAKKTKAIVAVDTRIVNIDTAEIMGVASGVRESSREAPLLGGGNSWHGWGGALSTGNGDFSNNFGQP
jgi:curli biogenesis system outer membrane secretion channel CsgG